MELRNFLLSFGFVNSKSDSSLFIFHGLDHHIYLLVYVDDIIVTDTSQSKVSQFVITLAQWFSLKDLGPLAYFLDVEAVPVAAGLFLSKNIYIRYLLARTNMLDANSISTPLSTSAPLTLHDSTAQADASQYRQVLGSLQYLSLTRPDVSFAVN